MKVRGCLVLLVDDTSSFGMAEIIGLLVLVCLLRWIDSVVDVVRVHERIMYEKLVIGKQIVNIASAYAPQLGLSAEEKEDFWYSFIIVLPEISKQGSIFIGSYLNGYVERDAVMVVSMIVWDLVHATLKASVFYNLVMQRTWWCATHSSRRKTLIRKHIDI